MRKLLIFLILTMVMAVGAACGENSLEDDSSGETTAEGNTEEGESGNTEGDTYEIRLAENQPEDYPTTVGDEAFAEMVEERSDGRIQVDVYAGGQLGDERSSMEQVQTGSIEMVRTNASPLSEFSDTIGVLAMPYLFESEEAKWEVLNSEVGDELLDTVLDEANMQGLAFYDSGSRHLYNSQKPVESPEDLEGMQIRVQESDLMVTLMEAFGASPTTMAFEEVYSGLEQGVVDGAENNFPSYYSTNHYEVADYYTLNAHSGVPEVLLMSGDLWKEMSEEDQELVRQAAKDSVEKQREAWDELRQEARTAIEDNGNEIIEIDDTSEWREAAQPVYDEYGGEYQEWIDRIEEAQQ
ncbi:TRAP transporter substrate-binding protein [Salibacterium aidingense]|uniref:TRAP transporter substrate-binding protein n=1 Tax=Salibacterium aidingense TaxID=384933 RepID=UPI000420D071|nr:TRAP transporter substrate-binding protein [Salibacterium aidingense]